MSSTIICVLCLEAVGDIIRRCTRDHVLCGGCANIFQGCPACNNFTMKASTVQKGDSKISAIDVMDSNGSDDDEVMKGASRVSNSVGTKRKTPVIELDSDSEDDNVHCVKCNEQLDEDDDFTIFECSQRHFACGACIQLLDECPVCEVPRPKKTKLCKCEVCVANNVSCDAETDGRPCITCSALGLTCVIDK